MERCSAYGELLPLYAEGELGDPGLDERIRLHVLCCPLCQDWLEEYDALTARLLECGAAAGGSARCTPSRSPETHLVGIGCRRADPANRTSPPVREPLSIHRARGCIAGQPLASAGPRARV